MLTGQKSPLRRFMAAVDAFEEQGIGDQQSRDGISRNADIDRELLARLRDKESHHLLSEALEAIENCRKDVADNKRLRDDKCLVKALSSAKLASKNARNMAAIHRRDVERYQDLKKCVDGLHRFFSDEIYRDPESVIIFSANNGFVSEWFADVDNVEHNQAVLSLRWIKDIITHRLDVLSAIQVKLTRKTVTAPKVIFMAAVCEAMKAIFDRPLYEVVAKFTDVALATNESTDDHEVRSAYRGLQKREAIIDSHAPAVMFKGSAHKAERTRGNPTRD